MPLPCAAHRRLRGVQGGMSGVPHLSKREYPWEIATGLYIMQRMQAGLRPDGAAGLCRICIIHEPFYFPDV